MKEGVDEDILEREMVTKPCWVTNAAEEQGRGGENEEESPPAGKDGEEDAAPQPNRRRASSLKPRKSILKKSFNISEMRSPNSSPAGSTPHKRKSVAFVGILEGQALAEPKIVQLRRQLSASDGKTGSRRNEIAFSNSDSEASDEETNNEEEESQETAEMVDKTESDSQSVEKKGEENRSTADSGLMEGGEKSADDSSKREAEPSSRDDFDAEALGATLDSSVMI